MEWSNRTATVYVNDTLKGSSVFFGDKKKPESEQPTSANTLFLYNLAPETTCYYKDLKVCEGRCDGNLLIV